MNHPRGGDEKTSTELGGKPGRAFEFPEFPAAGPKLASIVDPDAPDKYTQQIGVEDDRR
jgi:hypothetical protein